MPIASEAIVSCKSTRTLETVDTRGTLISRADPQGAREDLAQVKCCVVYVCCAVSWLCRCVIKYPLYLCVLCKRGVVTGVRAVAYSNKWHADAGPRARASRVLCQYVPLPGHGARVDE